MRAVDLAMLLPIILPAFTATAVMLTLALRRSHGLAVGLTLAGLAASFASVLGVSVMAPHRVTSLIVVDGYALFFMGLILCATFVVALQARAYLNGRGDRPEEFYVFLLLAATGASTLVASSHFASFVLGLEALSISLYALIAYEREAPLRIEAGIKYLILAAFSAGFLLFGMALIYAEAGTMEFAEIASRLGVEGQMHFVPILLGLALVFVGLGFKLALVPFHLWAPDVYQGAPAPVSGFIATVSKGAVFALLLRYYSVLHLHAHGPVQLLLMLIAIASMFGGNLLALLQNNVKRLLAYSSIAHLGYLLVALLSSGRLAVAAAGYYLVAYFVTTLGAWGVVGALSGKDGDAESLDDYRGLAWRRPWLAGVFTAMLLSLIGIPVTAGFIGKFYVLAAGVTSSLWLLVVILVINSAIGLFYYLRVVVVLYGHARMNEPEGTGQSKQPLPAPSLSPAGGVALCGLTLALIWLGVFPGPLMHVIEAARMLVPAGR